ncbi:Uncharacterized protein PCOAH_00025560 [Plasmodium coatneyi]|uniref:SANT domain-containing protein n=1 Tax=Plasmodium coatneyi TaxID=208452 RepID=A0A1B1E0G0_9APIC|nr:Uncharacterized protein PCOAH_00025560 [Plasmodium coatneyi]ANQ08460.1 Uncharacterized protein PCOAH_00025560 [Plasmodium coatneyi]
MKESQNSKENGGVRASRRKTYKQKQVKYMILKKLKRKMKQGLDKLEEQHEHLGRLLSNLNTLNIEESNAMALHRMTKDLTRQIRRVSEENNDDIAILKMEKDLIKADFTKNKNSLKIYNKDELQLKREEEDEEEEAVEEKVAGAEENEEEEEQEEHQQHQQKEQNDYEEGVVEQEEVCKIIRHDRRKKKKKKSTNAHSSHHFTNSFIPLQVFRENCLCMKNKCHHVEFSSENVNTKNWVCVDLYQALLRNKYYKDTHLCGRIFGEYDNNEIYKQEMRRMRKKKLLLNFLSHRRKRRKSGSSQGPPEGTQLEESNHAAQTMGDSYPYAWDQTSGAPGKGTHGRGNPTSCKHERKGLPYYNTPLCSLSNLINDQGKRNICWINMKNEINEEVSKNNSSLMTASVLTFLVSISKVFSCELIEERREKPVTNHFIVNKKVNRFYDYIPAQQYDMISTHHSGGTGHRSSAPMMNTHEMRGANQSYEVGDNHICLYLKREYVPPYLLNLGKKIKLILNFVSTGGLCGGSACPQGEGYPGEERSPNEEDQPCGVLSPPMAYLSARLEHDGGLLHRYKSLFLKKKKQKRKKSGKQKKCENSGGNGEDGNGCGDGSETCTVKTFDDNHLFNSTFLSTLLRQNLSEKKKYNYFYVDNVEYDHTGYDVEDIITHLEKVVCKWKRNSSEGATFSPLLLLNYVSKKYSLYSIKGKKKKKKIKSKSYYAKEEWYADGVYHGLGEMGEECSKGGKAAGMKGASQVRKSKAKGKGKVKGESEKKFQEQNLPMKEDFIPNGLKEGATTVEGDMETYYLTIHDEMLSYSSSNDEVTVKYYVTHMHCREFNLEGGSQDMPRHIQPTFSYYAQRKKQLEKMMKEHSALYKHIFKMWKEDIEIGEKERERKNIFAWGILPVRAYDHPNIFVPLPYGFKHNNKNLAYSSLRLKGSFGEEGEGDYNDDDDGGHAYGGNEKGNVMEKKGQEEKKKDYMNIKYANLTGPCITWRKNCISLNASKKRRNPHFVQTIPYCYCMKGPKMPLFSLERNVLYWNENNRSVVPDGSVTCKDVRSNDPFTCKDAQNERNFIWDKREIKIFLEKYFLYPKNFEKISQYLEFKNTKQCVDFYYMTKNFFNFKKFLLIISLSRVKRNKKQRPVGNDTTKKNPKEEIVAQLMEKLERNYDPSEFEQSNFFQHNVINLRHFFQNYFVKAFSDVQSNSGERSGDRACRAGMSPPLSKDVTTAQNIDGDADGAATQRTKTIVLENMSDGYVVPKNYKFILSANKKLCFLVKNEENLIYSGINSDIIEIVYNDNNVVEERKKRKNDKGDKGEKKKKVEKVERRDSVPFPSQIPSQLTLGKETLVDYQQPSTATCSSMIMTPPLSNSNEVSEKVVGEGGFSLLSNDPPQKGFNASATGDVFTPTVEEEKAAHRQILHANGMGNLKKTERDNDVMYGNKLLNLKGEEKTHHPRESDEKNLQNGEPTGLPAMWGQVKERGDKRAIAYNCNVNSNRDDYNPFGENGQVVNPRRNSMGSSKRGEDDNNDDDDNDYDEDVEEVGSLVQLRDVKAHDIHNVDSSSSVFGVYPPPSNDGNNVGRRVSYPDSNDSMNNPFESNVKIETSEESLYKCFEFLKNINWKDTGNVEAVRSKNVVQMEPMEIGRYSAAPVTLEGKGKKVSRKSSIQSIEGVYLQKEKNIKRKEIIPAGKSKAGGGSKDNTHVGELGQWEEASTGHTIHGRNKDGRNHNRKKGKTRVNHSLVGATTKRKHANMLSWNGISEGIVGEVGGLGAGAGASDVKRDLTVKPEDEKARKRKKTSNAQMSEEVMNDDRTNSMVESQLRAESMVQVCDVSMSEGLMSQSLASQEHQPQDALINSESLDTQNLGVHDSNEMGGLPIGGSHLPDTDAMKQDRLCSGDHINVMPFNNSSSAIPLQGEDRWDEVKRNGGSSSVVTSCKKGTVADDSGAGNEEEKTVTAELAANHPWEKQPSEKQAVENPPERSNMEHIRNSIQSSKSSNQCSMESLQHMESYEGGSFDDPSKQPFRKTATKWTDREKEIYFEVYEKEGKNWDTLVLALHPYGKTREQIKNFYQNTIVKKRKSEAS